MTRVCGRGGQGAVRAAVVDHGDPSVVHGTKATTAIGCGSDCEVLDGLIQAIAAHEILLGGLRALRTPWTVSVRPSCACVGTDPVCTSPKVTTDAPVMVTLLTEALATAQATLDAQLVMVHTSLPASTAAVMFIGHSDPRRMTSLNPRKVGFESAIKRTEEMDRSDWWTASDGRALKEIEKAKHGLLFWGSSRPDCLR
jgi:RNA exonuclease 1